MRTRACALALLLGCSAPRPQPPRGDVVLTVEGKVEHAPFRFGADDLPNLPRGSFRAVAPASTAAAPARFEGVALEAILSDKMELAREADTAIVHSADGIAVPVALAVIHQLRPLLADRVDGAAVAPSGSRPVPLSLVWPNLDHPGIDTDPRMPWWWVSDVQKIVIQSWGSSYGKALQVPAGAPNAARAGADVLSSQCIGCHRVRGLGGTRGPELARSGGRPRLEGQRLRDHLRTVGGGRAPGLSSAAAEQVLAFLDAVAASRSSEEEIEPAPAPVEEELPPVRPDPGEGPLRSPR